MGIVRSSVRATENLAATATSAAGALAGAAAGGAVGAVRGAGEGLGLGSRSVPAAALAIGALGAAGLVDWPVLIAVGGGALVLRQLRHSSAPAADSTTGNPPAAPRPGKRVTPAAIRDEPRVRAATRATGAGPRTNPRAARSTTSASHTVSSGNALA